MTSGQVASNSLLPGRQVSQLAVQGEVATSPGVQQRGAGRIPHHAVCCCVYAQQILNIVGRIELLKHQKGLFRTSAQRHSPVGAAVIGPSVSERELNAGC